MSPRLTGILLVLIVLIGTGLRLYKLDEKSLWTDEIATVASANGHSIDPVAYRVDHSVFDPPGPVPAMIYRLKATESPQVGFVEGWRQTVQVLRKNVHPPLFFFLMNRWTQAFGSDPAPLRVPAVIFGVLCIPLMFAVARSMWSEGGGGFALLATALMAFSGYQVDHAQDARPYTLLVLLTLAAMWLVLRLIPVVAPGNEAIEVDEKETNSGVGGYWPWVLLAVVLSAGLLTQYFFINVVALCLLILVWRGRGRKDFIPGMLICSVGVALLAGWSIAKNLPTQMAFMKAGGHYTSGLWNPVQLPEKLWRIFCEFVMPDSSLGRILPAVILLLAGLCWLNNILWARKHGEAAPRGTLAWRLIWMWLAVIVGGQLAIDLLKDSHTATIRRYLLLASPACYLLLAYALVYLRQPFNSLWLKRDPRLIQGILAGLTVLLVLANTLMQLVGAHHSSDEFRLAAAAIQKDALPGDVILVNKTGAPAVGMAYYLPPEAVMWGVDAADSQDFKANTALHLGLQALSASSSRVWVVYSHAAPSTRKALQDWFFGHGYRAGTEQKFPGVRVLLYAKAPF